MQKLQKLKPGDKVAILSPSFAAAGKWPHVYELGLSRLRDIFGLIPVEYPTTKKIGASTDERAKDLIDAFQNPDIKGVIATLGGNDQVTYIKNLSQEPFANNPKPFFGFSDNSHFENHLFLAGVPSFYGGSILTQFAMQNKMDDYTVEYLKKAFFENGEVELVASDTYNDVNLNWNDPTTLTQSRVYEKNDGWHWDAHSDGAGLLWGGCLESIDEMLRHGVPIPTHEQFENVVLMTETSEEIPEHGYVHRVYRALGERGILSRVQGVLVGRPKAWEFNKQHTAPEKDVYRKSQRETTLAAIREYNKKIPVVQNLDFGHTDPQIPMPYGGVVIINSKKASIKAIL
ncbi:MAG: S66 peptidase family protein [Patescibacteria group bacterium]